MPGGIDPNTHFDGESCGVKSVDSFYSGTKSAVAGGTTTTINLVIPQKGESLIEAYFAWRAKADEKAVADYAFRIAITW